MVGFTAHRILKKKTKYKPIRSEVEELLILVLTVKPTNLLAQ
jgi:hypothetical protein